MSTFEKISPDDPRLTAYALGEMEPADRTEFEQLLQQDETARTIVAEISSTARSLGVALASEPAPQVSAPLLGQAAIIAGRDLRNLDGGPLFSDKYQNDEYAPAKWLRFPQMYFAITGLAAACFAIGFVIWQETYLQKPQVKYTEFDLTKFAPTDTEGGSETEKKGLVGVEPTPEQVEGAGTYERGSEDAFVTVKSEPISTFPINIDALAYSNVRHFIQSGHLPPRNAVRIEEMVNYFPYSYAVPTEQGELFAAHLEVAGAPWAPEHRLVRIGLKGRDAPIRGTVAIIAKDVKLQVEFNPSEVQSYRLLGYENRMPHKGDFNNDKIDAGEINAGHTVTALYEVVPVGAKIQVEMPAVDALKYQQAPAPERPNQSELLTLNVRYMDPTDDVSRKLEFPLRETGRSFDQASADFKFAASVAAFGMILRDSPHKGAATFAAVSKWAQSGLKGGAGDYRTEFIGLVRQAERLSRN